MKILKFETIPGIGAPQMRKIMVMAKKVEKIFQKMLPMLLKITDVFIFKYKKDIYQH
ncbi:MAG: hypothetical protein QXW78_01710 [Candidatus Thermoplasmatota archaeon]